MQDRSKLLEDFFEAGTKSIVESGTHVVYSRDENNGIHYIKKGYMKVYATNPRGQRYVHIIYGPGDIFPLLWIMNRVSAEDFYYQAMTKCELYTQTPENVQQQVHSDIAFSVAILNQVIEQFRVYTGRVNNLQYTYASERLAFNLFGLAERFGVKKGNTIKISVPLSHQILADSSNISREVVTRELAKLTQKGIATMAHQRVTITDVEQLKRQFSSFLGSGSTTTTD